MRIHMLVALATVCAIVSANAVLGRSLQQAAPPTAEYRSLSQALAAQPRNLTIFLAAVKVSVLLVYAPGHLAYEQVQNTSFVPSSGHPCSLVDCTASGAMLKSSQPCVGYVILSSCLAAITSHLRISC